MTTVSMHKQLPVDVLIIGGGPVGVLIGYQLRRSGCSVLVIEKEDKTTMEYGRANGIFARSTELLDQLGLADELVQQSHFVRESYTYNSSGERVVPGRVWNFVENIEGTKFDFGLMLRQQHIEKCFRDQFVAIGGGLHLATECTQFEHTNVPDEHGSYVTAVIKNLKTGADSVIKSKFIVGADGAQSFVRSSLKVPFHGAKNEDKWIRIDAKIKKTDMPTPRDYASIESPTHGNVLWAPLDRGITRIGYVLTTEQEARYDGKITEEIAIKEALEAVKPFHVEFESVSWWTLYIVRQRVATSYRPHPQVLLAGDACHTHSSGAAQGLNTGIHDACNLGWKLALVLKGFAKDSLLDTYSTERQAAAWRLIDFDRKISMLMANKWPEDMERPANKDMNQALADLFDDAFGYNTGLGISYTESPLSLHPSSDEKASSIVPGTRAHDVELYKPGSLDRVRLHGVTPNWANIYMLAFVGDPRITLHSIKPILTLVDELAGRFPGRLVQTITIAALANQRLDVEEALGTLPSGRVFYDRHAVAHHQFGVNMRRGGLVVLRPDGYVGFIADFDSSGVNAAALYLTKFFIEKSI